MKAWKTVVDSLVREKTKFVFGLVTGPWDFWDYLAETDVKPILVRQELSSVRKPVIFICGENYERRLGIC